MLPDLDAKDIHRVIDQSDFFHDLIIYLDNPFKTNIHQQSNNMWILDNLHYSAVDMDGQPLSHVTLSTISSSGSHDLDQLEIIVSPYLGMIDDQEMPQSETIMIKATSVCGFSAISKSQITIDYSEIIRHREIKRRQLEEQEPLQFDSYEQSILQQATVIGQEWFMRLPLPQTGTNTDVEYVLDSDASFVTLDPSQNMLQIA